MMLSEPRIRRGSIAGAARSLPVDDAIPELRGMLRAGTSAVLQAPPGAGKTTRVPLALLGEPWLGDQRIVMLEPRRLATRAVATFMAGSLGEKVGETVGYRVRRDSRVGPRTRIEVVTEGILTRWLLRDPTLEGVGLLIFDEFHERSMNADLGLALALQSRELVRPDLRIMVMSATLDGAGVARLLGGAPLVTSEGRSYPVTVKYMDRDIARAIEENVAAHIERALREESRGDVLAFLPGGREIRRVASLLRARDLPNDVTVMLLYGDLPQRAQDAAIAPSPVGTRKVVLSTPIAETSLTIEGVTMVIDSGLVRVPRFSPRSGMSRLETVRVSRSSADQRSGRAGRVQAGTCYRLWPEHEQHHLQQHSTPEILQTDIAPLALDLAAAGISDPTELAWLDQPPTAAYEQARALLARLGALDRHGRITEHGRSMVALPTHPRIAHMLLAGNAMGIGVLACDIGALLEERDILRGDNGPLDADIGLRLDALRSVARGMPEHGASHAGLIDHGVARRVIAESGALRRQLGIAINTALADRDDESAGVALALAYPDRIGRGRADAEMAGAGRFVLSNGRGAVLTHGQSLSTAEYIVAADLDGGAREARIFLAASLTEPEIRTHFSEQIALAERYEWDDGASAVRAWRTERLGAIVLRESRVTNPDNRAISAVLMDRIRKSGTSVLPWTDGARSLRQRMGFVHRCNDTWPDVSDETIIRDVDAWLTRRVDEDAPIDSLTHIDVHAVLSQKLDWQHRAELDALAPTHYTTPAGSRIPIDYSDVDAPRIAARLQEMFGARVTPTVAGGSVPLTVQLLSPARRPVQVTRDLAGFWRGSYFDVRKELKGRYPKHPWPDDPLSAPPTSRAKRRGE